MGKATTPVHISFYNFKVSQGMNFNRQTERMREKKVRQLFEGSRWFSTRWVTKLAWTREKRRGVICLRLTGFQPRLRNFELGTKRGRQTSGRVSFSMVLIAPPGGGRRPQCRGYFQKNISQLRSLSFSSNLPAGICAGEWVTWVCPERYPENLMKSKVTSLLLFTRG